MPIYIAMLRGINVSGHKSIKMEELRSSFTEMGFRHVKTYVQSGNVVFSGATTAPDSLSRQIEQRILRDFTLAVPVLVRTSDEMREVIRSNPFPSVPGIDLSKLHVTFLSHAPPKAALDQLLPLAVQPEQLHLIGREIILYCPHGYGKTKLSNTAIERKLSVGATTRNWKTVNALEEMARS